jgi:hypothetical protein
VSRCHPKLALYLDEYIEAAGIAGEKKGPLFRAALRKTKMLAPRPLSRTDALVHGAPSCKRCRHSDSDMDA